MTSQYGKFVGTKNICWYTGESLISPNEMTRAQARKSNCHHMILTLDHIYPRVLRVRPEYNFMVHASMFINSRLTSCPINIRYRIAERLRPMIDITQNKIRQVIDEEYEPYRLPNSRIDKAGAPIWDAFWANHSSHRTGHNKHPREELIADYWMILDKIEREALVNRVPELFE